MFRKDLLPIIRNLNTIYTAVGICHASYVDCLLAHSQQNLIGFYYEIIHIYK
jgi:hypothetical protein